MKPTYEKLEQKLRNHRIMWIVFLFFCIADILAWYGKIGEVEKLKNDVTIEKAKREQAENDFKNSLCLPRIKKFDAEMGLINGRA